jgi:biopolymer transport protein ExbB
MLYLMIIVSVAGLLVAMERFFYLHKGKIRSGDFVTGIVNLLKKNRAIEALGLCEETPGPVAIIVKVGLLNSRKSPQELVLALQSAAAAEIPLLEKRVNTLLFLSRVVQLLGLLGALLVLREPFEELLKNGSLMSTQSFAKATLSALSWVAGTLGVSILFYTIYHFLHGRVRALVAEMERAAVELQSQLISQRSAATQAQS